MCHRHTLKKLHSTLDDATFQSLFEQGPHGADGRKGEKGSPGEAVRSYGFLSLLSLNVPFSLWQHI